LCGSRLVLLYLLPLLPSNLVCSFTQAQDDCFETVRRIKYLRSCNKGSQINSLVGCKVQVHTIFPVARRHEIRQSLWSIHGESPALRISMRHDNLSMRT
jgi:hypothetical protein